MIWNLEFLLGFIILAFLVLIVIGSLVGRHLKERRELDAKIERKNFIKHKGG